MRFLLWSVSPGLKWDSKVKEKNAMLKWETKEVITLWIKKKVSLLAWFSQGCDQSCAVLWKPVWYPPTHSLISLFSFPTGLWRWKRRSIIEKPERWYQDSIWNPGDTSLTYKRQQICWSQVDLKSPAGQGSTPAPWDERRGQLQLLSPLVQKKVRTRSSGAWADPGYDQL